MNAFVRFDDLDGLNSVIARGFGAWGPVVTIDQPTIDGFAAATSSPAPPGYAPDFLLPCLLPKVRPDNDWTIGGHRNALHLGCPEIRFLQPVRVGASVHCRSRLAAAALHPRGVRVTMDFEVENVADAAPCMRLSIELLYQGDAA